MDAIDREFFPRLCVLAIMNLVSSPLRLVEKLRYGRALERTSIHPAPVFVLGHWRSGTTHLQNLLSQDSRFGCLDGFQAIAPGFCLVGRGIIRQFLKRIVEPRNRTRPMDRVPFSLDTPQEEELALANTTIHSFSHAFVLPRQAERFFQRYVLFEGLSESEKADWLCEYLELLRKVTLANNGKRLLLKNVTNTTRIPEILDQFPDAKFIFIHRNPYDVFASTTHLHQSLMSICQLQSISEEQVRENVLDFYPRFMKKYLSDRDRIPQGHLVEIGYDDLVDSPIDTLCNIYHDLDLGGFERAESALRAYVESIRDYKRNRHEMSPADLVAVSERLQIAFEEWGYDSSARTRSV